MKKLALAIFLFFPSLAQAADSAWVQAVAGGYEARLVTAPPYCPALHTDKGDVAMTVRAAADANFALTCSALLPAGDEDGSDRRHPLAGAGGPSPAHPGAGRHRLPHQGRDLAGLQ